MASLWIGLGAVSAFLGVALGAFAAHGLADRLEPRLLEVFRTGAQYQMYHALALLAVGLWEAQSASTRAGVNPLAPALAAVCFVLGTLFFSGSLYALALTGQRWLGMITPLGGLLFLAGWAAFAFSAFRQKFPG
jgi:uncharacterized membrane protein YgdD (TMEM256/DUF423 family)